MQVILLLIIVILLFFSACLSAMETAIIGSSPGKMQRLKNSNKKDVNIALNLLKNKEKVNNSLLLINSISNTTSTTLAAVLLINIYGEELGTIISSGLMSILIIIFAEVIPKAIAVPNAEKISLMVAPYVDLLIRILNPINYVLNILVRIFCFIFRIKLDPQLSGAEELRGVIEHQHQEGNVFKEDKDMLGGILDISALTLESIMVHRSNMKTIDASINTRKIVAQALSTPYTRIPLYKGTKDNIIGILHIRNLLKSLYDNDFNYNKISLEDFILPPLYVPEYALVSQQLHEFRKKRSHLALVVDEYGEIKGLVTLEDILEEIVGQIDDEHDLPMLRIVQRTDKKYVIHGAISIRDLNREMNWDLPDSDAHTLAGLLIHHAKRLPEKGESFQIHNVKFTIIRREKNQIISVLATI